MIKRFSVSTSLEIASPTPGMEPSGTYLIDILSALSGVNVAQTVRVVEALGLLQNTGRVCGEWEAAPPSSVDFAHRLDLSRETMLTLFAGSMGDANPEQVNAIRERLARIYHDSGFHASAQRILA